MGISRFPRRWARTKCLRVFGQQMAQTRNRPRIRPKPRLRRTTVKSRGCGMRIEIGIVLNHLHFRCCFVCAINLILFVLSQPWMAQGPTRTRTRSPTWGYSTQSSGTLHLFNIWVNASLGHLLHRHYLCMPGISQTLAATRGPTYSPSVGRDTTAFKSLFLARLCQPAGWTHLHLGQPSRILSIHPARVLHP